MAPPPRAADERFPGVSRLSSPADFDKVFGDAVRSADAGFTVLARANGRPEARLGLAVAKRRIRKAVARNLVKRRIRESFRRSQSLLRGLDVVVLPRGGVEGWDGAAVEAALERHWQRVSRKCVRRC